jgi:hypothetical protein
MWTRSVVSSVAGSGAEDNEASGCHKRKGIYISLVTCSMSLVTQDTSVQQLLKATSVVI